jgi:hypothetical protein
VKHLGHKLTVHTLIVGMFQAKCIINGNMVMRNVEDENIYFEFPTNKFKNQLTIQLDQERVALGMRAM